MIGLSGSTASELILASASPRRMALLRSAGLSFRVMTPDVDELHDCPLNARALCLHNASLKADQIAATEPQAHVIGADTIVVLGGQVLGKPKDLTEGKNHLSRLSGRVHEVMTGVALRHGTLKTDFVAITYVKFRDLNTDLIERYQAEVETLDKAGGYAIQEHGDWLVESIEGDESNVIGLPLTLLLENLARMGFPVPHQT